MKMTFRIIQTSLFAVITMTLCHGAVADQNVTGLNVKKSLKYGFKPHGVESVSKDEGYPVRSGDSSMRFEVRAGDCGFDDNWSDCQNGRERHEYTSQYINGEHWLAWSIYVPKDYPNIYPVKVALGQFHSSSNVPWMFQNDTGGISIDRQIRKKTVEKLRVIDPEDFKGRWHDILLHFNFTTDDDDGYMLMYLNGDSSAVYSYFGGIPTGRAYFKFGIYRSFVERREGPEPTQVVFYDDVRLSKTCEESALHFDCNDIGSSFELTRREFKNRQKVVERAKATQGSMTETVEEKQKAACADPNFAAMLPDLCN